jgi:hypothetical protein
MHFIRLGLIAASAALLSACATSYSAMSWTGGYQEAQVSPDVWRVTFSGNGYTTKETTQTYWLYHCAQLTLSKGFDGFTIVSNLQLTSFQKGAGQDTARLIQVRGGGGGVRYHYVYVPGGSYSDVYKPSMQAEIKLLKKPLAGAPPKVFDAARLAEALGPIVNGPKCGGNVCPHIHRYLYPQAAAGSAS